MTEVMSWTLPAKDKHFTAHDLNLDVSFSRKGSYYEILSFLLIKGSPKYLIERVPFGKPNLAMEIVSQVSKPA